MKSTFGVVDAHSLGDAVEPFEGAAVAAYPGFDALVLDDLGVLMTTPCEGHHEDPRFEYVAGCAVGNERPHAEVNLRHFADGEIKFHRRRWCHHDLSIQEPVEGVNAARIAVCVVQRSPHRDDVDALCVPRQDLAAIGVDARYALRLRAGAFEQHRERGVIG